MEADNVKPENRRVTKIISAAIAHEAPESANAGMDDTGQTEPESVTFADLVAFGSDAPTHAAELRLATVVMLIQAIMFLRQHRSLEIVLLVHFEDQVVKRQLQRIVARSFLGLGKLGPKALNGSSACSPFLFSS